MFACQTGSLHPQIRKIQKVDSGNIETPFVCPSEALTIVRETAHFSVLSDKGLAPGLYTGYIYPYFNAYVSWDQRCLGMLQANAPCTESLVCTEGILPPHPVLTAMTHRPHDGGNKHL